MYTQMEQVRLYRQLPGREDKRPSDGFYMSKVILTCPPTLIPS